MHTHAFNIPSETMITNAIYDLSTSMPCLNLDICKPCPPEPCKKAGWGNKQKEEVNPMASYAQATIVNPASIEAEQREIVRSTLRTFKYAKANELEKQFGLTDDEAPRTAAEFIERITSGQYTVDEKYKDERTYSPSQFIRWRDPSKVEDRAGYKDAVKKLDAAYADAKLKAALLPIADLLKLVEDFKAFTA